MTHQSRSVLAAAVGLWMALSAPGQEASTARPRLNPVAQTQADQQVIDAIHSRLQQNQSLRGCRLEVTFNQGTAEVKGAVASPNLREEAVWLIQGVPGVERVRDRLTVGGEITQVQGIEPPPVEPPVPQPLPMPSPAPGFSGPVITGPMAGAPVPGAPAVGGPPEAMPLYQAPPPSPWDLNPPKMPPNAWPTYAPYPNNSRVAYPNLYPYNSWPFIGPIYPFPKVPLGWRAVKLEWQDGFWWYSTHSNSHDWWRLRYW